MKLNVRVHTALRDRLAPTAVASRATFAFRRLAPDLRRVRISVTPLTGKNDKLAVCRATAVLSKGGRVYATAEGPSPRHAIDAALERLHALTRRRLTLGEFKRQPSLLRSRDEGGHAAFG